MEMLIGNVTPHPRHIQKINVLSMPLPFYHCNKLFGFVVAQRTTVTILIMKLNAGMAVFIKYAYRLNVVHRDLQMN